MVDLFAEESLENTTDELRYLTDDELEVLKESYEYSKKATKIIKDHFEYYKTFEYKISITDKYTGKDAYYFDKVYFEEYLIPWPDNRSGGGGSSSTDNSVHKVKELPRYDYPENPMIHVTDTNWIEVLKGLYELNINKSL